MSKASQILRLDANDAAARTIDVRNEKERDRHHQRKDEHQNTFCFSATGTIAN